MSANLCPFCSQSILQSPLVEQYLSMPLLVESIRLKQPHWKPSHGACLQCLESYYDAFSKQRKVFAGPEEDTIIITNNRLIHHTTDNQSTGAGLIMIHGPYFGKKYDLSQDQLVLGRGEEVHMQIPGENVSRKHAIIERRGADFFIKDLSSTNGTFINTKKITEHKLQDGDLILLGNCILKYISGSNAESHYYDEIYTLATKDGLTQAYNKTFFLAKLDEELRRSKRYDRELSLIIIDFDHFSQLNNTHGHVAGDITLKTISKNILQNIRKEDILGRYGGEEFCILLPEIAYQDAMTLAQKLLLLIQETPILHQNKTIHTTVSMGVASLNEATKTGKDLIEMADHALYIAKNNGRNCVR